MLSIGRTSRLLDFIVFGTRGSEAVGTQVFTDISRVRGVVVTFSAEEKKKYVGQLRSALVQGEKDSGKQAPRAIRLTHMKPRSYAPARHELSASADGPDVKVGQRAFWRYSRDELLLQR